MSENEDLDEIVFITKTGRYYHKERCGKLKYSKIPIKLSDAIHRGYEQCPYHRWDKNRLDMITCSVIAVFLIILIISVW